MNELIDRETLSVTENVTTKQRGKITELQMIDKIKNKPSYHSEHRNHDQTSKEAEQNMSRAARRVEN